MLLGLALAVLLALMLQLNALRVRRAAAFDLAGNGVIHLKAWIVVDTAPARFVGKALMLAGRIARAARARRLFQAAKAGWDRPRPRIDPTRSAGLAQSPWRPDGGGAVWSTGPPPWQVPRARPIIGAALNQVASEHARQTWRAFALQDHGEA